MRVEWGRLPIRYLRFGARGVSGHDNGIPVERRRRKATRLRRVNRATLVGLPNDPGTWHASLRANHRDDWIAEHNARLQRRRSHGAR